MGKVRDWGDVGAEGGPGAIRIAGDDPATDIPFDDPPAQPNKDTHLGIADQVNEAIKRGGKGTPESTKKPKAPRAPSEDDLALDFASRHAGELRFVFFWGKWLKWTAGRWQVEKTLAAYDLARKICHGHSLGGLRARTVAAIELMARTAASPPPRINGTQTRGYSIRQPGPSN
jgi:hypothetical protein